MISSIKESLESGSLTVVDYVEIDDNSHWNEFNKWVKDIRHLHRIVLKDTRTNEQVLIAIVREGE